MGTQKIPPSAFPLLKRLLTRDSRWLILLCTGRIGLPLIFLSYSAVLPFVTTEWKMTGAQAGSVQSAWHGGYLISLFMAGFLAYRFGAKKTLIRMSIASAVASMVFAFFSEDHLLRSSSSEPPSHSLPPHQDGERVFLPSPLSNPRP